MSMISEYQPGALITWPATNYYSGASVMDICGTGPHTIGQWFNTANFQTSSALVATTGQARVFPNIINGYGGCRGEALKRFAARDPVAADPQPLEAHPLSVWTG